jgi:DNA-binding HxlR family transcriptional regulator
MGSARGTEQHCADLDGCPLEATLQVIGGKWKAVILYYLMHEGTHRFAELRRKIAGISERMLTQQLRELEADDVVRRQVYAEVPPKVEYSLTDYGQTLAPVTRAMCDWGQRHTKRLAAKSGPAKPRR